MNSRFGVTEMYPFWSAIAAALIAQLLKPVFYRMLHKEWKWSLITDSGGFPSSHSALVSALALSVGIREQFNSTIFAVTMALACIVIYDAANVRYYSGQNIKITQQMIKDIQNQTDIKFDDPIYHTRVKNVLGHKWIECIGGILIGLIVALVFHLVG